MTADERQPGSIPVIGGGGANGYHAVANVNGPGVALARSGSGFGNAWWIESDFWAHNTVMFVKNFKGNDPRYTYYVLDWIDFSKHNSGGAQPSLNRNFIYPIPIHIPQLPEQRKIAEILRTWDEALEKLTAFRAAKARRLDGLAAWLIHDEQAERLHLRDFLSEVSTRNHGQQVERVLSVTNSAGFVLAEDQFAHRVASADLSNYKIVRRGQYAYNPSRINVGSIARLDAWEDGALSPMYVVFRVRNGLDSDFFRHWLRSAEARQRIALAAQGSVRETVSFGDLGSILIPVPTIERQQSISRALNAGRGEIALIEAEIEALTRQKRGLMQKLLTGEWRVPLNHAETPIMTEEAEHAG
ncbi:MAG TPA: restriction endonuclease subunit S [Ochrobactrum intermedium]|uniref:Restriction endonuclease subunit S n=1 Tax=Brucella intermedia TaxID=94625 RepID=A0A7V6PGG3_9HYPH|nr:restriction endonuclease subunit S [Brucella intermedia]